MDKIIRTAVLGSTGYVGLELINILCKHPKVVINSLGSNSSHGEEIYQFDSRISNKSLPKLQKIENIDFSNIDIVFFALPHNTSCYLVDKLINKHKIIDLSADFRLDDKEIYKENYKIEHPVPELLKNFVYGLPEINNAEIKKSNNIAVPGCYPTSILLPLIPLLKNNLIKNDNIIIDSKSGYSGAGKKYNINNIIKDDELNFYNYNTNQHRHICEIKQEISKFSNHKVSFSFNPHVLPIYRGMMSTIYCDINSKINISDIDSCLKNFYKNSKFINIVEKNESFDFFKVQYTNNCYIKFFKHYDKNKIIIVSLIDNLIKGASGQAIQCMNIMSGFDENLGLNKIYNV